MRRIEVAPLSDGWRVSVDAVANDLVFRSGRAAEWTARRLAARLAHAGVAAELRIRLRDGSLAGREVVPAAAAPREPAIAA
jgi:hypothetical protein